MGGILLFWAGLLALVVWGIRAVTRQPRSGGGALEIMRQRLAAGEQA